MFLHNTNNLIYSKMTKYIFVLTLFTCSFAIGQNSFKAIIKNGETKEILVGASPQMKKLLTKKAF